MKTLAFLREIYCNANFHCYFHSHIVLKGGESLSEGNKWLIGENQHLEL